MTRAQTAHDAAPAWPARTRERTVRADAGDRSRRTGRPIRTTRGCARRMPNALPPKAGRGTPFRCSKLRTETYSASVPSTSTTCARYAASSATPMTASAAPPRHARCSNPRAMNTSPRNRPIPSGRCASANAGGVSCSTIRKPGDADFAAAESEFRAVLEKDGRSTVAGVRARASGLARIAAHARRHEECA